ncbi:MAG: hypothetical protein ACMUIG_02695, partial [Thermoplasmatota archaeon]
EDPPSWISEPKLHGEWWEVKVSPPIELNIGSYNLSVECRSRYFLPVSSDFIGLFNIINNPPVWLDADPFIIDEESEDMKICDLPDYCYDMETESNKLSFNFLGSSEVEKLNLFVTHRMLWIENLEKDWYGNATATIEVSDGMDSAITEFRVIVKNIPDMPVLEHVPDLECNEDEEFTYQFKASDRDRNETFSFQIDLNGLEDLITSPEQFHFDGDSGLLKLNPTNDMVGIYRCSVSVSDGILEVVEEFKLTVKNINDPPEWVEIGGKDIEDDLTFIVKQDDYLNITMSADDIDPGENKISYTMSEKFPFSKLKGGTIYLSPDWDDIGTYDLILYADDGESMISVNIIIIVENIPDSPVGKIQASSLIITDKENLTLTVVDFTDLDMYLDDEVTFSWNSSISGDLGTGEQITVKLEPGLHNITLVMEDSYGLKTSDQVFVKVNESEPAVIINGDDDDEDDDDGSSVILIVIIVLIVIILVAAAISVALFFIVKANKSVEEPAVDNTELKPGGTNPRI